MTRYWKNKFKNEYGVYVKTIILFDDYRFTKVYIAYTKDRDLRGYKNVEIYDKVFNSPQEIDNYFKNECIKKVVNND